MIEGTGSLGGLQREAVLAALQKKAAEIGAGQREILSVGQQLVGSAPRSDFRVDAVTARPEPMVPDLRSVDAEVRRGERLAEDLLTGKVSEFHEVAAQIKRADLTLKFSLEIRNRLVDAYREVMRMSV